MSGQDPRAYRALHRHRADRRAHRLRDPRERLPAAHGAQHRRQPDLRRQWTPAAALDRRAARIARSHESGADVRARGLVSGTHRVRREVGPATVRTRIKICGITRTEDARAAAQAGADAIGLVLYPSSPRYLSVERAVEIRDALPPFVQTVALFVNPEAAQVAQIIGRVHPAMLQFHGDETPEFCAQFGLPFVKACRVRPGVDALEYLRPFSRAAAWLFDSFVPEYGGVGESFDWSLVPALRERHLILSGGLSRENVAEAIRQVRPWGVDVSSGVESAKGIKDAGKIAAFIAEVRNADV